MQQSRKTASQATLLGLLGLVLLPGALAAQASVAVEGLIGRANGPVTNDVLGVGARVGLPLGVSLAFEVSRWEPASAGCPESEPDSLKCDVGGWLGFGGLRIGIPTALPLQPYLGAMIGRSLGSWTPGFDDDPSALGFEGGVRGGLGPLEGSIGARYVSVSDLGYESIFDENPGYTAILFRLGYAF